MERLRDPRNNKQTNEVKKMKQLETIFLSIILVLIIAYLLHLSITSTSQIQDLKHELALTKVQAKQKCNERFLGVGE